MLNALQISAGSCLIHLAKCLLKYALFRKQAPFAVACNTDVICPVYSWMSLFEALRFGRNQRVLHHGFFWFEIRLTI